MLQTATIFQSKMVLQREKSLYLWGTCEPSKQISLKIQNNSYSCVSDKDGNWCCEIGPLQTSFQETLEISTDTDQITYEDVQVGDVWLAAGQSNMEFYMHYDMDFEEAKKSCLNENIRFFDYPEITYPKQLQEADYSNFGFWRKATPEDLDWFSAVGYYFAKDINQKYNIPIGIVGCNWGGTPASSWMSEEAIRKGHGEAWIEEYNEAIKDLDLVSYEEAFRNNPMSYRTNPFENIFSDLLMKGKTIVEIIKTIYGEDFDFSQMDPSAGRPLVGPKSEQKPTVLYESMVKQIAPYGLKGILFYQGESDGDKHPELYETMFPALIQCFRDLWNEELHFLFVQIAPFGTWLEIVGEPYIQIRKAQQHTFETVSNTGMAVISDVGMELDIHPKKKQPVGHRLALQALNRVYHESDVLCEAPTLTHGSLQDDTCILSFENTGEGLTLASITPDQVEVDPTKLGGLVVKVNGETLDSSLIQATAKDNQVILTSPQFTQCNCLDIELGCTAWYRINLYNSASIPARPASIQITK